MERVPPPPPVDNWVLLSTRATKLIAGVVSIVTIAGFALAAWSFYVDSGNPFRQREYGYDAIAPLHAGNTVEFFTERLGVPTSIRPVSTLPERNELLFLKDEYAVSAVTDGTGRVLLYSVLACNPDFRPVFRTPAGTTVGLNSTALDDSEHASVEGGKAYHGRTLSYVPAVSRTSVGQLIEVGSFSNSADSNFLNYFLGVNSACAATEYAKSEMDTTGFESSQYSTVFADDIAAFRASHPPNFYTEAVEGNFTFDYSNCVNFEFVDSPGTTCLAVNPLGYALPYEFTEQGNQ